ALALAILTYHGHIPAGDCAQCAALELGPADLRWAWACLPSWRGAGARDFRPVRRRAQGAVCRRRLCSNEMAGSPVPLALRLQGRCTVATLRPRHRAAGTEGAARWGIGRAGDITLQQGLFPRTLRADLRHRRQQSFGVGM